MVCHSAFLGCLLFPDVVLWCCLVWDSSPGWKRGSLLTCGGSLDSALFASRDRLPTPRVSSAHKRSALGTPRGENWLLGPGKTHPTPPPRTHKTQFGCKKEILLASCLWLHVSVLHASSTVHCERVCLFFFSLVFLLVHQCLEFLCPSTPSLGCVF